MHILFIIIHLVLLFTFPIGFVVSGLLHVVYAIVDNGNKNRRQQEKMHDPEAYAQTTKRERENRLIIWGALAVFVALVLGLSYL